jgi:outer membrane protein assembly factor BamD
MKRAVIVALALLLAGCSAKEQDQLFLDEMGQLSKEEILAKGDALAADKDREQARRYYSFLADSFPNDPVGRRAALKIADTYFESKDVESLTEAQLRYKDFANRFPNDSNRAYAMLQLAKTYSKQRKGPLRDLTPAREATATLRQMAELFPDSPHNAEAQELLASCLEDLANHELEVAKYYITSKGWQGAYLRLTYLIENYPQSKAADEARGLLAKAEAVIGPLDDAPGASAATPTPRPSQER